MPGGLGCLCNVKPLKQQVLGQNMFYELEFSLHRNISRSDLCPSTTVSSSTSTGTLTDTGTITEVKSVSSLKCILSLAEGASGTSTCSLASLCHLPGGHGGLRPGLAHTLHCCALQVVTLVIGDLLHCVPGSVWTEVQRQPQTSAQSVWRGASPVSGFNLTSRGE